MMDSLRNMTWLEVKLFLREPVTVIFTLALPLMVLYILGGVFGNQPDTSSDVRVYGGHGPTDFYTPAYVALAVAGVALISVPVHMVEYREFGVLRRFRASSVHRGVVLASQLIVTLLIATAGAGLLLVAAFLFTDVSAPISPAGFIAAYGLGAGAVAAMGLLLGTVLPTARSAQTVGLLMWFTFMFLSGAGPPPEVLPDSLRIIGDWLPLTPVIELLQEPWLTGGWAGAQSAVAAAIAVACGAAAWKAYRWQ